MKRRFGWGLLVLLVLALVWLGTGAQSLDPGPSIYSKRAGGWMLARHYLEAQGHPVEVITTPLEASPVTEDGGAVVLVLAFPWKRLASEQELMVLDRHLRQGGTVLVAVSGEQGAIEERVLDRLGLSKVRRQGRPPIWLPEWWRQRREGRRLESPFSDRPPLTLGRDAGWVVSAPPGARIDYVAVLGETGETGPDEVAMVFETAHQGGRVMVLPTELLVNGRLASGEHGQAHGALLESLRRGLGEGQGSKWAFDEYHLGLSDRAVVDGEGHRRSWDLFAAHLLLLYLLAVVALARGFGPVFAVETVRSGSAATFLRGLGSLHHRLGHHAAAARRLVERSRRGIPEALWDETFDKRAATVRDGGGLLALARDIADHLQRRRS